MRYITLGEVLSLHSRIVSQSGGRPGIRDFSGIASAVAQPRITVDGNDAYPTLIDKAAALGFALVDIQEATVLQLAAGDLSRESLVTWLNEHVSTFSA